MQPHLAVLHEAHDPNSLLDVYEVAEDALDNLLRLGAEDSFADLKARAEHHYRAGPDACVNNDRY